jgi:exosome complex RNA-binding protein Rrp4
MKAGNWIILGVFGYAWFNRKPKDQKENFLIEEIMYYCEKKPNCKYSSDDLKSKSEEELWDILAEVQN